MKPTAPKASAYLTISMPEANPRGAFVLWLFLDGHHVVGAIDPNHMNEVKLQPHCSFELHCGKQKPSIARYGECFLVWSYQTRCDSPTVSIEEDFRVSKTLSIFAPGIPNTCVTPCRSSDSTTICAPDLEVLGLIIPFEVKIRLSLAMSFRIREVVIRIPAEVGFEKFLGLSNDTCISCIAHPSIVTSSALSSRTCPPLFRSENKKWKWYPETLNELANPGNQSPTSVSSCSWKRNSCCADAAAFSPVPSGTGFITRVLTKGNTPSIRNA